MGGGYPPEPIQAEMRAMSLTPLRPPSFGASRMEALRDLWTVAGLDAVETREITLQRTFTDFDDFWTTTLLGQALARQSRRWVRAMPSCSKLGCERGCRRMPRGASPMLHAPTQ